MTDLSLDPVSVSTPGRAAPRPDLPRLATIWATAALRRFGLVALFLTIWQVGSAQGWINPTVFPPLDRIIAATWVGVTGGALLDDIAISLQRSGLAYAAAVGLAIPLGLFMVQIRAVEQALDPILQFFRQTSTLALYPCSSCFWVLARRPRSSSSSGRRCSRSFWPPSAGSRRWTAS
jgi:sulfonate transport system permease protein